MENEDFLLRQIHLDFHMSEHLGDIGARFDKRRWQETLRRAEVNSITCFSKCVHGWSYHPTKVGKMHPHLDFDLLRAQVDASREIGVRVQVYLSAGFDSLAAREHPEWLELDTQGAPVQRQPLKPGFDKLCFLSPYLDYLCAQIEEAAELFDDCDGIFLDIVNQAAGCSPWAMAYMVEHGLDARLPESRKEAASEALRRYFDRTNAACRSRRADMPVFHNSGHVYRGRDDFNDCQSHFELESLPTGGWGYDHFPESAAYVSQLGKAYLGMTGKFHSTWGEIGGYKHTNALRYECAAMLAYGAACSVGDQLSPSGELDSSTYELIGAAYREVKAKEPWCVGAVYTPGIAVLSSAAETGRKLRGAAPVPGRLGRENAPDTGAVRLLLEEHLPFALLDRSMDFSPYAAVVLPDDIRFDDELTIKVQAYLDAGGKVFISGESGLRTDSDTFALDVGADWEGTSPFEPDYVRPREGLRPEGVDAPFVHYRRSQRIRARAGESLGEVYDPWFNRSYAQFSGHQHTPMKDEPSGYDCGVEHGSIVYLAHPVFTAYRAMGHITCRRYVAQALRLLLGDDVPVTTNLPSLGRITVTRQAKQRRWIVHLLFAPIVNRGGKVEIDAGTMISSGQDTQVIEDFIPLRDVEVSLKLPAPVQRATLEPQGEALPLSLESGCLSFTVPEFTAHQMVVLHEGVD